MKMTLEQRAAKWARDIAEVIEVPAGKQALLQSIVGAAMAEHHFDALLQNMENATNRGLARTTER